MTKQFALIFRMDITTEANQPTKEQMMAYMQQWQQWISDISTEGAVEGGNHFSRRGRTLRSFQGVSEKPYIESGNSVAGYLIIAARNWDQASTIAAECPILKGPNTSVEIREIESPS